MVVVDHLDERLDLGALGQLLGTHGLGHLGWVSLNSGNDGVRVGSLLCSVVELLDDDDLREEREAEMGEQSQYFEFMKILASGSLRVRKDDNMNGSFY